MTASVSLTISDETVAFWMANGNLSVAHVTAMLGRLMAEGNPSTALATITDQVRTLEELELQRLFTIALFLQDEAQAALHALQATPAKSYETADYPSP